MDPKETPYIKYYDAFLRSGNMKEVNEALLGKLDEVGLLSATEALAVGCGSRDFEIDFFSRLLPNLKKVSFVEPNVSCFKKLRNNLHNKGFKDEVQINSYLSTIQEWKNNDERFDVILMSHCLYYLQAQEWKDLFKTCFDQWLKPGGLLYVRMTDDGEQADKNPGSLMSTIYKQLGDGYQTDIVAIKQDLASIDKFPFKEYPDEVRYDLESFDEDVISFLHFNCEPKKTREEISKSIEVLKKKGYKGASKECMCVLKKYY